MNRGALHEIARTELAKWLHTETFKVLVKVVNAQNLSYCGKFGRIIYNSENNPVLTNGTEPTLYLPSVTIGLLKQEWAEVGMSRKHLDEFDNYTLIEVQVNVKQ